MLARRATPLLQRATAPRGATHPTSMLLRAQRAAPAAPASGARAMSGSASSSSGSALRTLGTGLLGLGLIAAAAGGAAVATNEGMARSAFFWRRAFPIYLHYRWVMFKTEGQSEEEIDAAYLPLHERYCHSAMDVILHLRGFYIKLAQMGAVRGDFVHELYLRECEKLQDQVPAESGEYVRELILKSLGRPVEELFSWFDDTPIGSASIGQVHRARTLDGREVVVKLQYPNVEEEFHYDIETIIAFATLAQPAHVPMLSEVKKQFATEFDYVAEAQNMRDVRENLLPLFEADIDIPEPIEELCSKHVLTMTYIPGKKLVDGIKEQYVRIAESRGMTIMDLEAEQKAADDEALAQGREPDPGMSADEIKRVRRILGWRDKLSNVWIGAYNATMGGLLGAQRLPWADSPAPLNTPDILSRLFKVHAHQVLVDGVLNGDPHPGNFLLMPDGRIGLIDYGQVKRIGKEQRHKLARLIIALADGDDDEVVRVYSEEMGHHTRDMNRDVLRGLASLFFDRCDRKSTDGLNLQLYMEKMDSIDPLVDMPDDYVMPGRVSVLLRGLAIALRYEVRMAVEWREVAERVLKEDI